MGRSSLAAPAAAVVLIVPSAALARDYADTARNVVPSGQYGGVPVPAGADAQAKLYDSLTPRFDQVSAGDLQTSFKSEKFGVGPDGPARNEAVPRRGVELVRDRFNVPHITGRTRDDVTWAMGWVLQEDRGLLLAQARYAARIAAVDVPNINAFGLVTGLRTVRTSRQIYRMIERNGLSALRSAGAEGRGLLHDIDVFVAGMNARLRAEKSKAEKFSRVDLFATNALAGQIFGQGGGDEVRRSMLLDGLRKRLGSAAGETLFGDLSERFDADTPTTGTRSFPYAAVPRRAPATRSSTPAASSACCRPARAPRRSRPRRAGRATSCSSARTAPPRATRCSSAARRSATSTPASRSRPTSRDRASRRAASTRPRTPGRS